MSEFQIALKKISEINTQIRTAIGEHNGKKSIARKCERISYDGLKSIVLETQTPFLSKFDQKKYENRKNWSSFWMLSPIIGMKQLRQGETDFLVGITKVVEGRPNFCLILAPGKKELYIGLENKAYKIHNFDSSLNRYTELDELMSETNRIIKPIESLFFTIVKNKNPMNATTENFLNEFKMYKDGAIQEKIDESPMNLIGIAEGKYDFFPHLKTVKEWDIAPFDALITACGNRVTQRDGIMPLEYNNKGLKIPAFIAKNNFEIDSIDFKE